MMIGTHLGPYEIREEVGKGGMATVYRARQTSVDRDVAIKVILRGIAGDDSAVARFQREAKLIARLEHPHILPVYDFDGSHEPPYIVMRFLDSGTLKEVMAQGLLPQEEIAYLMRQVCSALDYAHRQGIVHRDIKPSNIMIDREGNTFVTDLGIARITGGEAKGITETGMIIGTPDYMSPEQAMGAETIDYRTDIYALGVMVFEMLTGKLPYNASNTMGVLMQHMNQPVPSAREHNPDLTEEMDAVIGRAMAKDTDSRYQSAAEFSTALTGVLGGSVSASPSRLRAAASTSVIRRLGGKRADTDSKATPSEQNKTVTALYVNAAEYAEVVEEQNGSEAARRAMNALWNALERIVNEANGGVFVRTDNDLLALWGAQIAHEDDAERAVRCGLTIQTTLKELGAAFLDENEPLPLNIGINSGLALLTPGEKTGTHSVSGATISLANRLMQNAQGTILITHEVFRQVLGVFTLQPDEPLKVRGRIEKVNTYRIIDEKARAFRITVRGVEGIETNMIGRDAEHKQLQNAFLNALEDQETQVVTIISEAGIGKSRLLHEFDTWAELRPEGFRIFNGRATPAMTARPYALIRDMISYRFEILDSDAPDVAIHKLEKGVAELIGAHDEMAHLIGHLCGFDFDNSPYIKGLSSDPAQLSSRARQFGVRFFTTLAKQEPVVLELEDIHYADDASLDFLNELFMADSELQLLAICLARPVLDERRPTWGSGQAFHMRIELKPLDKRDSRDLAREILQNVPEVPKSLRDVLVERAEGNPYFMEELVKMLIDDHAIIKESDGENELWCVEETRLGALNVPSTLFGLLEARLDTLLYPEKLTLQRASVFGRVFYDAELKAIDAADETHISDLSAVLTKLVAREFIYKRETSAFAGSIEYTFAQAMLRDTIYDRLLERQLKTYHTAAGDWLASLERADEYSPLIADHYEKAGERSQAAIYLQRAGDHHMKRGRLAEAAELYQRALDYIGSNQSPERTTLLLKLGEAAGRRGDIRLAQPLLEEALAVARKSADVHMLVNVLYELSLVETDRGDFPKALAYLDEALPSRAREGSVLLANVLYGLGNTHFRVGNTAEAQAAVEECIALAQASGEDVLLMFAHNRLGTIYSLVRGDAGIANQQFQAALLLARRLGHLQGEQTVVSNLGLDAAIAKKWDDAIRYSEEALRLAHEMRDLVGIHIAALNLVENYLEVNASDKSRLMLREALLGAIEMQSDSWLVGASQSAGILMLSDGDIAGGLRLIGLAKTHPAASADTLDDQQRILDRWKSKLGLSAEQIEAGMAAGKDLDLHTVVRELMETFAVD